MSSDHVTDNSNTLGPSSVEWLLQVEPGELKQPFCVSCGMGQLDLMSPIHMADPVPCCLNVKLHLIV